VYDTQWRSEDASFLSSFISLVSQAVNALTVNITKTNYKLFGSRMLNKKVNLKTQNVNVEKVIVITFVGVFYELRN